MSAERAARLQLLASTLHEVADEVAKVNPDDGEELENLAAYMSGATQLLVEISVEAKR